jgi:hypothetical protein
MFGERLRKPIILNALFQLRYMEVYPSWFGQQYFGILLVLLLLQIVELLPVTTGTTPTQTTGFPFPSRAEFYPFRKIKSVDALSWSRISVPNVFSCPSVFCICSRHSTYLGTLSCIFITGLQHHYVSYCTWSDLLWHKYKSIKRIKIHSTDLKIIFDPHQNSKRRTGPYTCASKFYNFAFYS